MERTEFDEKYTAHLNPQQQEAVHAVDGAILLLAVPGSGKTTVLVTRLGYMIYCRGIDPSHILTMTYTVAATREMKQRFARLFGTEYADALEFRTINGLSAKIIAYYTRLHGTGRAFDLLDNEGEIAALLRDIYKEVRHDFATPSTIKDMRTAITYVKNMMLSADEIRRLDTGVDRFPEIYDRYCAVLRSRHCMDYDDQMVYAKVILEKHPDVLAHFQAQYPYICVDESQDTSKIQHALIRLLAGDSGNLFMVGDEDQSIYGFRAAYPDALMAFETTYPGARVLLMEENYRSTPEILDIANAFIRENTDRHPKTIRATRASGSAVHIIHTTDRETPFHYLLAVAQTDENAPAVLYRNNDSALPLIDALDRQGISYRCRQMDDSFFTHRILTDVTDIIRFAADPQNADIFLRIYYKLSSGISRKAAEFACDQSRRSGNSILLELLQFPELSKFTQNSVTSLLDNFPRLLRDTAARGIRRIFDDMRYGAYVEDQGLDPNKYAILCLLAKPEPSLASFLARLEHLRTAIATSQHSANPRLLLSTIHSSKGLEYDTVYLLDVLDGILPLTATPDPTDEARRRYQEERRLFYVGMTRAKNHLFLFDCAANASAFVSETLRVLPREVAVANDVFPPLPTDLLGKRYVHREHGIGTITAHDTHTCFITYKDGEAERLTLGEMLDQRAVVRKKAAPPANRAANKPIRKPTAAVPQEVHLSPEEKERLAASATPGRPIRHIRFGDGVIRTYQAPYVQIQFSGEERPRTFDLIDSIQRGLLLFSGD